MVARVVGSVLIFQHRRRPWLLQVGSLQTENAALHSRTSILEKVLDMRNEQIQVGPAAGVGLRQV